MRPKRSASAPRQGPWRLANGPISRSGTSSGRPSSFIVWGSIRFMHASGEADDRRTAPRRGVAQRLARGLARRAGRARSGVSAGADAVQRILGRGEPVYGINTGFGKLAGVRIEPGDLTQLQRNIVLSHAAGVGDPAPDAVTRLMMALKLGSLAQGASGVRSETLDRIEAMLSRGVVPVVPAQGSVGASGDLAPLAHMAATMIGVGEARLDDRVMPAAEALVAVGLEPLVLAPKEGLALLNGTQFSTANALVGLF